MNIEQDLVLRDYWIGYLRERSLEVLGERFHITPCAIVDGLDRTAKG
jgi:hypothetical protein